MKVDYRAISAHSWSAKSFQPVPFDRLRVSGIESRSR